MEEISPIILAIVQLVCGVMGCEEALVVALIDWESGFVIDKLGDYGEDGEPHAFGLMQLHDGGAGFGYPVDLLLNPAFNVLLGCKYLQYLEGIFPNNVKLQVSAYNQGPGGAAKRGYGFNEPYVNGILSLRHKYAKVMKGR